MSIEEVTICHNFLELLSWFIEIQLKNNIIKRATSYLTNAIYLISELCIQLIKMNKLNVNERTNICRFVDNKLTKKKKGKLHHTEMRWTCQKNVTQKSAKILRKKPVALISHIMCFFFFDWT